MKNTKEITTEYRMNQWAAKMAERAESGLSIVKYCEREGMPERITYYNSKMLVTQLKAGDDYALQKTIRIAK